MECECVVLSAKRLLKFLWQGATVEDVMSAALCGSDAGGCGGLADRMVCWVLRLCGGFWTSGLLLDLAILMLGPQMKNLIINK